MDEQISDEQGAVDPREASKMKRAGQACVTFFVVFLISLLAFGKAPSVWTEGSDGGQGGTAFGDKKGNQINYWR